MKLPVNLNCVLEMDATKIDWIKEPKAGMSVGGKRCGKVNLTYAYYSPTLPLERGFVVCNIADLSAYPYLVEERTKSWKVSFVCETPIKNTLVSLFESQRCFYGPLSFAPILLRGPQCRVGLLPYATATFWQKKEYRKIWKRGRIVQLKSVKDIPAPT